MNAFRKIIHSFILSLNIVVVLLMTVCGYAYMIKPAFSSISPFLGYGFPLFALVNLCFIFYWLIRLKGWILLSIFGVFLTWGSHRAWFPINCCPKTTVTSERSLKVLSYNVMYFSYQLNKKKSQAQSIVDYISQTNADVVCLQEVGPFFMNNTIHKKSIREKLKAYPYIHLGAKENRYSVVLLSKYPVVRHHQIKYVSKTNSSVYYDLRIGKDTIRLINNHLESNKLNSDDKNNYTKLFLKRESEQLSEVAEVLGNKVGNASTIRSKQADAVARIVKTTPNKLIVCGDFNDVPGSYTYHTVRNGLIDTWIEWGNGWGNTFHESFFLFRIDFILHSTDIKSCEMKIDQVKYSDHYPIRANFILP